MHTSSRKRLHCDERDRAKKDDCLLVECGEHHKVGIMIELVVREGIPVYKVARNAFEGIYLDLFRQRNKAARGHPE